MRKNYALLGATIVMCLVVRPAVAEEADIGEPFKLATIAPQQNEEVVRAQAATMPAVKGPVSKTKKIAKKKPIKKRVPERLFATIDLSSQTMNVMVDGQLKHSWIISSGRKGFHTPRGSYKPYYMATMHYSKKYDNAPMPHSVFYSGGFAVHATSSVRQLGQPASHGCTRLAPGNAKKFFDLVLKYKKAGTRIKIVGSTPAARSYKQRYARVSRPRRTSWDKFADYSGNYVSYSARRRPAANTRRIRIGRPAQQARRSSHSRIFDWKY